MIPIPDPSIERPRLLRGEERELALQQHMRRTGMSRAEAERQYAIATGAFRGDLIEIMPDGTERDVVNDDIAPASAARTPALDSVSVGDLRRARAVTPLGLVLRQRHDLGLKLLEPVPHPAPRSPERLRDLGPRPSVRQRRANRQRDRHRPRR